MRKPPFLRNNNGTLQVRVRIDGRDAFCREAIAEKLERLEAVK